MEEKPLASVDKWVLDNMAWVESMQPVESRAVRTVDVPTMVVMRKRRLDRTDRVHEALTGSAADSR